MRIRDSKEPPPDHKWIPTQRPVKGPVGFVLGGLLRWKGLASVLGQLWGATCGNSGATLWVTLWVTLRQLCGQLCGRLCGDSAGNSVGNSVGDARAPSEEFHYSERASGRANWEFEVHSFIVNLALVIHL